MIILMKHIITILAITIFLVSCSSNEPKDSPLTKAENTYAQGDYEKAAAQLTPLANKGDAQAQYTLGYMYYYGQGVRRDRQLGTFWMQQSAKQGNTSALKALELLNQDSRKGAVTTDQDQVPVPAE